MICLGILFTVFTYFVADISSFDNTERDIYDRTGTLIIGTYTIGMEPTISYLVGMPLLIFLLIGIMVLFDERQPEVKKDVQSTSKKTARKVR